MARLLSGKPIAEQIYTEIKPRVALLKERGVQPAIVFVRVGEDPASQAYVGMKEKRANELGFISRTIVLETKTTQAELIQQIEKLNADPLVHGILVQAPLPSHISETAIFSSVLPTKDVDGFHPINVGKLFLGDTTGYKPCTPAGIQELLVRSGIQLEGAHVAILGRGNIVGKPMAAILCQKSKDANATVTLLHSKSRNIEEHTRRADIVIAAMGQAEFLRASMIRPGAVVVDVGVNRIADPSSAKGYKLVGDVAFDEVAEVASAITPNPGGVGPMTIAMLMLNTLHATEYFNSLKK